MKAKVYSVSQINRYVKGLFENDVLLSSFFMEAELSNFKPHSSGHFYFTAKEETSALNCVMFKGYANDIPFVPENGMNVILYGRLAVYEKTGQYQMYVEMMEPMGVGSLHVAFEQLKKKLDAEGLFSPLHKQNIPENPQCIAVITSPTGAAVRDIINVSKRRNKQVQLVVVPVLVQGEGAGGEIAKAIDQVNKWKKADVIIVGRGGGSMEDLWAFNEEIVARAIFRSKIPVISAVGHETDFTIADFVADLRAATPSAAAEIATPDEMEQKRRFERSIEWLHRYMKQTIEYEKENNSLRRKQLTKAMRNMLETKQFQLMKHIDGLQKVSPLHVLKRGYSLAYNEKEELVSSVICIEKNDKITISFIDGTAKAIITETKKK